jgi:tetratricopeptide (TPR) repeat protein
MTHRMRPLQALVLVLALSAPPLAATCGGGGGGGMGGMRRGGSGSGGGAGMPGSMGVTYAVPWNVVRNGEEPPVPAAAPSGGAPVDNLVLYWFPTSPQEAKASDLQASHDLTLATARCVTLALVTSDNSELRGRFPGSSGSGPYVVLADAAGKELGRITAESGPRLRVAQVEKLVDGELKSRESALKQALQTAADKEKHGDVDGAAALYQQVWGDRCLVPGKLPKRAADALKKLGRPVPEDKVSQLAPPLAPADYATPRLGDTASVERLERTMDAGLAAEDAGRYGAARALYARAHRLDPADPVPLRYLGELYRHHLGDWVAARQTFNQILAMPADPMSRAVALHGLGKMTIHEGSYQLGLSLLERSVATFPLALAYRNLAVYWNTEGQVAKAQGFAEQALALDPDDPYAARRPCASPTPTRTCSPLRTTWRRSSACSAIARRRWPCCTATSTTTSASTRCAPRR